MKAATALTGLVFRSVVAESLPIYALRVGGIPNVVAGTIIASETYNLAAHFVPAIALKPLVLMAFAAKTLILASNASLQMGNARTDA